ncbi:hypothetical protein FB451DRAFT_1387125 [Mycena latifolia]|nr:hypothetical protein FB451DRAFT_1387125 [Mycena latifolia]
MLCFLQAWTYLVESRNPQVLRITFPDLAGFILGPLVGDNLLHVKEMLDGIGDLTDVASLVMRSLNILLGDSASSASLQNSFALHGIMSFIAKVDACMVGCEEESEIGTLSALLVSRGIVKTLALGARRACTDFNAEIISACLALLARLLSTPPGYDELPTAIREGLLRTTVLCGTRGIDASFTPYFPILLGTVLPTSLVYYAVLAEIEKALLRVADITSTNDFRRSSMFTEWQKFTELAPLKACDNIRCHEIRGKDMFRRCAECANAYYCSAACRSFDWRHGGHWALCESYLLSCLGKHDSMPPRDRAFLRALLHHDYEASKAETYSRILRFMHGNPMQPLIPFIAPDDHDGRLAYEVSRPSARPGRIEPHLMQVPIVGSSLPKVHDSLQCIARELPRPLDARDMAAVAHKLEALLVNPPADAIELCYEDSGILTILKTPMRVVTLQAELLDQCIEFLGDSPSAQKARSGSSAPWFFVRGHPPRRRIYSE